MKRENAATWSAHAALWLLPLFRSSRPYLCVVIHSTYCRNQSFVPTRSVARKGTEALEDERRLRNFHEMDGVDDSDAPPRRDALDRLRVQHARIHSRARVHEPRAQMRDGLTRVALVAGDFIRGDERWDDHDSVAASPLRCASKFAGFVSPSRRMYGFVESDGSGHQ